MNAAELLLIISSLTFQDTTVQKNGEMKLTNKRSVRESSAGIPARRTNSSSHTKAERAALMGRIKRGGWDYN